MFPLIDDQDKVTLINMPPYKIHQGDIIAFLNNGEIVVHRVIRLRYLQKEILFCQKGDSSPYFSWIKGKEILGKVIEIENDKKIIKLTVFFWLLYNRFLALLGSFWVFINEMGKKRYVLNTSGVSVLSKPERGVFLFIRAIIYVLTNLWRIGNDSR